MERKDQIFIGLLIAALLLFLVSQHKPAVKGPTDRNVTVPDVPDSDLVGMSLCVDENPPDQMPFHGRAPALRPPPLSLLPSTTDDALQGVATAQRVH